MNDPKTKIEYLTELAVKICNIRMVFFIKKESFL
jgi:hypothetical protein